MTSSALRSTRPTLAPLPLRLVLGLTFLWAGWGKIEATMPVKGDDAARLANMGIITPQRAPSAAPPLAPEKPLPSAVPGGESAPSDSTPRADAGAFRWTLAQATTPPPTAPAQYSASDFPNEQPVKRLWGIALRVSKAGDPPADATGKTPPATWPVFLTDSPWPKAQAQAVFITELLCGAFVLLGLLTRPASLALAGVMLGAIWLDQCTPAIQSGSTTLGFLPAHGAFDVRAWMPFAWQCALFFAALSLTMSGAGRLSVDLALRAARRVPPAPASPEKRA